jgi:hypothetical protein
MRGVVLGPSHDEWVGDGPVGVVGVVGLDTGADTGAGTGAGTGSGGSAVDAITWTLSSV